MTRITLEEAAARTLKEIVAQACENQETVVVTGPDGEVARVVPASNPVTSPSGSRWKGRTVRDADELARLSPEELKTAGWVFPDESSWVDDLAADPGQDRKSPA